MIIILILWILLIFMLSHQTAAQSGKLSNKVKKAIKAKRSVRKYAHYIEYLILGVIAFVVFRKTEHQILNSFLLCYINASIDEIHQYFIPGRAMALKDVLIDSSGALLAMIITRINLKINKKSINKLSMSY